MERVNNPKTHVSILFGNYAYLIAMTDQLDSAKENLFNRISPRIIGSDWQIDKSAARF